MALPASKMSEGARTTAELTAIERIARYATALAFEDLDSVAVVRAREVVLDTLGTALGGSRHRLGRLAAEYIATTQPGTEATVLGDGRRSTLAGAAWANAVMAKVLGMDDTQRMVLAHIAAELVPVMLAVGEYKRIDGRKALAALVAGYEVFNVLQTAVQQHQRERGLDQKGQVGSLASAVVAGVLLGLDAPGLSQALALAVDMACGTEQHAYDAGLCDTKDLLAGYGARNGIYAARMAEFGFKGPPGALDGRYGYFHAFGSGYDPSMLDGLGNGAVIAGTSFKPHAGCRQVHPCVDAIQALLERTRPPFDQIASIEVGTYRDALTPDFRVNYHPVTSEQATLSLPTSAAIALVRGKYYREDIEAFEAPEIQRLRQLVRVYLDEEIDAAYPRENGCVVRVTLRDGTRAEGRVRYAKGEPENPMTRAAFEEKFRRLAGSVLSPHALEQVLALAATFEGLKDMGDLVRAATHAFNPD